MIAAALLSVALAAMPRPMGTADATEIAVRDLEGEAVWSIRARSAEIDRVLADLAARTGRRLEGFERLDTARVHEPVAIELADRPFSDVVHVLAGTIGARARVSIDAIELCADLGSGAESAEIDTQSSLAWMRFLKNHTTHPLAAAGEMALAELYEREEKLAAATTHYLLVVRNHPESDLVADALLRAGLCYERLGEWNAAAETMTKLANLERAHPHQAVARLELARSLAQRGDGSQALFLLDALERLFPVGDVREREARLYVRARALGQCKRHAEALETLERADALSAEQKRDPATLALRAEALEHFDRPAEAARAWLGYAQSESGTARDKAFTAAAHLALLAGDDVAVLFVEKLAAGTPAADAIASLALEARRRLGVRDGDGHAIDDQDLARAEDLVAARSYARARAILERLWRERSDADESGTTRLALAYARALDAEEGLESALAPLRAALETLRDPDRRRMVHVQAGELYELHERLDAAIAAYGGSF